VGHHGGLCWPFWSRHVDRCSCVVVSVFLLGKLASKHASNNHNGRLQSRCCGSLHWLLLCIRQLETFWRYYDWRWCRRNWRNRAMRQGFLFDAISCANQSWRSTSSYGRHEAPLPAFKHTTMSQHTMQQISIVKTRKTIIINVYYLV
jgi:hypothetical protein